MNSSLTELFAEWERWVADVLESHMSYPLLALFRSPHDETSWITSLGAVLDAATLMVTSVEDAPYERAKLLYGTGRRGRPLSSARNSSRFLTA